MYESDTKPAAAKAVRISLKNQVVEPEPLEELKETVEEEQDPPADEAPEEKAPEQEEIESEELDDSIPAPIDNADEFASNNQDDKTINEVVFGGLKTETPKEVKPREQFDVNRDEVEKSKISEPSEPIDVKAPPTNSDSLKSEDRPLEKQVVASEGDQASVVEEEFELPSYMDAFDDGKSSEDLTKLEPDEQDDLYGKASVFGKESADVDLSEEYLESHGNLQMMSDPAMKEVTGEQPFSELESKEIKLANEYLERMNKQVYAVWKNPYKGLRMYRGVIKFALDENGVLQDSFIYRASGLSMLDDSVLKAIRSIKAFKVPKNKNIVNKYYRNLRFLYNSVNEKTELMPFEVESKDKQEEN